MANSFGPDILIQAPDPKKAALFYVNHLGFEITDNNLKMIGLHGKHINLFIEPGPSLGPVLEVTVDNVVDAKQRLVEEGCEVVKDEPDFPRCYVKDVLAKQARLYVRVSCSSRLCAWANVGFLSHARNGASLVERDFVH